MNPANFELAEGLISKKYIRSASAARRKREGLVTTLLSQRQLPREGWDDEEIELLLTDLSNMDSNNFVDNCGVGEREGRVFSRLVKDRYYGMSHGVGRSGDLAAEQPKAAGSSLLSKLTNLMTQHALKLAGMSTVSGCIVLPVATGMAITLSLIGISAKRPGPKKVIWPRIDQKTCLKSIVALGLTPIIVENKLDGDELVADMEGIKAAADEHGAENILAVVATTSCFAPRVPENVVPIAELCKLMDIPFLVNNAYGCQTRTIMKSFDAAGRRGRIDGIIQSTDKNYMVPVGGAVLATVGGQDALSKSVSSLYPGRASGSAVMDLFITLLSMGEKGYLRLLEDREQMYYYMIEGMTKLASKHGERVLDTRRNQISIAMTLGTFIGEDRSKATQLGGMLFARCVSGTRVVTCIKNETVGGISFKGYGSHHDQYPHTYLAFAVAVGIRKSEVDTFLQRLDKTLSEFRKKSTVQPDDGKAADVAEDSILQQPAVDE